MCLISQLGLHNQVQIGCHGWTFLPVSETVAVAAAYSLHCIVYCKANYSIKGDTQSFYGNTVSLSASDLRSCISWYSRESWSGFFWETE